MQLFPTRETFHVAAAGIGIMTLGATARSPAVAAFGGAMLLAIGFGRAIARVGAARLREAGFVLDWSEPRRVHRVARGAALVLRGELRNRSAVPIRVRAIRPVASALLSVAVEPAAVELAPFGSAMIDLTIEGRRVGRWGIHGIAVVVAVTPLGAEALYEEPLHFATALGIEVLPRPLLRCIVDAAGGRARRAPGADTDARVAGAAHAASELREFAVGDPFKRIAWKASARRGHLMVREVDGDERATVWLVVDASIELWAGPPGRAPLDEAVDQASAAAAAHLRNGDRIGIAVVASRLLAWVPPGRGAAHAQRVAAALVAAASAVDADRSDLDEHSVARRVSEHAATFDRGASRDWRERNLDALAARVEPLRRQGPFQAPFSVATPFATGPREQALRHYLAAFGIEAPPRPDGEHPHADLTLAAVLERLAGAQRRPAAVHVWAPAPQDPRALRRATVALRAHGAAVHWMLPRFDASLQEPGPSGQDAAPTPGAIVRYAVRVRAQTSDERGARMLRGLGIQVERSGPPGLSSRGRRSSSAAFGRGRERRTVPGR